MVPAHLVVLAKLRDERCHRHEGAEGLGEGVLDAGAGHADVVAAFHVVVVIAVLADHDVVAGVVVVVEEERAVFWLVLHGQAWIEPAPLLAELLPGARQFVAWNDGEFEFNRQGSEPVSRKVTGTRSIPLKEGWSLSFPAGWDAPAALDLGELKPWSALEDKATRHFSGSARFASDCRTTMRSARSREARAFVEPLGKSR